MVLSLNKLETPSHKNVLCQVWLKLVKWFWFEKEILNFVNVSVSSHFTGCKIPMYRGPIYTLIWQCTPSVGILQIQGRELMHQTCQLRFPGPGSGSPDLTGHQLCPYKKNQGLLVNICISYLNIFQLTTFTLL